MTISIQQIAPLGQITWTEGIEETTKKNEKFRQEIVSFLTKHINHDWGSLTSKDDAAMNDRAVKKADGGRLHSGYQASNGQKIWIVTNGFGNQDLGAEFCHTTVMFPSEY
mgnify:FL=1